MSTYRKKLIEVAMPLDAINKASAREKLIRHGSRCHGNAALELKPSDDASQDC